MRGGKLSTENRVLIGSTLFAFVSSGFLYLLPPQAADHHIRGTFRRWQGNAYVTVVKFPLGQLRFAQIYENGKPLGPPNSDPQDISAKGGGMWRIYRNADEMAPVLMFSSSDNTDPNTNGRTYRLACDRRRGVPECLDYGPQ